MGRGSSRWGLLLVGVLASCTALLGDDFEIADAPGGGSGGVGGSGGSGGLAGGGGATGGTCPNGVVESGESCDDGNHAADDGCNPSCQVEGSCAEPLALPEVDQGPSFIQWSIESSTGGASQVDLAACDGSAIGSGSDRIYAFTLTDRRDVTVHFDGDFPHAVRLQSAPCDPQSEVLEPGQADGCTTADGLFVSDLEPGAYFVVVDGATEDDAGSFVLTVEAACPKSALGLHELRIGEPEGLQLYNRSSSCAVDLRGLNVRFVDIGWPEVEVDLTERLEQPNAPEPLLGPEQRIWLVDEPLNNSIQTGEDLTFTPNRGGVAALCRGPCTGTAEGLLDLLAFSEGQEHPALPGGISFAPSGLTGIVHIDDAFHLSYQRVEHVGTHPDFLRSDWRIWFFPPTVFWDSFEDGTFDDWTIESSNAQYDVISFTSAHGNRSLEIQGNSGTYDGLSFDIPQGQPTRIQFAVRGSPPTAGGSVGWVAIGADDLTGEDGIAQFRITTNSRFIVTSQGQSLVISGYTVTNWNVISYENIDWQNKTFDLAINGTVTHTDRGFWQQSLSHVTQIHLYNEADGWAEFDWLLMTE